MSPSALPCDSYGRPKGCERGAVDEHLARWIVEIVGLPGVVVPPDKLRTLVAAQGGAKGAGDTLAVRAGVAGPVVVLEAEDLAHLLERDRSIGVRCDGPQEMDALLIDPAEEVCHLILGGRRALSNGGWRQRDAGEQVEQCRQIDVGLDDRITFHENFNVHRGAFHVGCSSGS